MAKKVSLLWTAEDNRVARVLSDLEILSEIWNCGFEEVPRSRLIHKSGIVGFGYQKALVKRADRFVKGGKGIRYYYPSKEAPAFITCDGMTGGVIIAPTIFPNPEYHEGEIWRKPGPMGWCKIETNCTNENRDLPEFGDGVDGYVVRFGNFQRKRITWGNAMFLAVQSYEEFVRQMKGECRYLMKGHIKDQKNELGEH